MESGVPQGTVLDPLLFLLYRPINDLPENLNSTLRLFADDCVVYRNITSIQDTQLLQQDLETLSQFESRWQMSFNTGKCYVLRIPGSKSPIICNYKLGDSILQDTTSHTYLGVEIQQDWNSHINNITAQASKTLGFVRRNLGSCSKETKVAAYVSLVRPTFRVFFTAIWDPYTQELTQKVGKIQRRAARLVHKNYDWQTSVSGLIRDLGWDMLSTRRKIARLNILHKAIEGHLALPVKNYLRPAQRQTRRSHSSAFIEHQTRIDA